MTSREIREKFIKFFVDRGHKEIPPAPLVLENDPTTLFTSAGMQPLVPYLKGETHPFGKRLVNSQPSLRLEDIDEVGDNRHTTFFEMLGNWSLGDYFKKEQLSWFWEFLTEELKLPKDKLHVSVFEGNNQVEKDTETENIWKELGVDAEHIHFYNARKNWWSRSGAPEDMVVGDIGGPDSEVFYDFGTPHDPKFGEECHPNCDCGRFLEIGNSVFIQYVKKEDGTLEELPQKNVDFGGGLERLTTVVNNTPDIFQTDIFMPIIEKICQGSRINYEQHKQSIQVIADHIKASVFLIKDGVMPNNKRQGYVLRRLLRRVATKAYLMDRERSDSKFFKSLIKPVMDIYPIYFSEIPAEDIEQKVSSEILKFRKTLEKGLREIEKTQIINGERAFFLYESYGFPLELTEEIAKERGQSVDKKIFEEEFEKHKELSRTASAGMFKGGLAGDTPTTRKLHTAAHLLQASLRKILGEHVEQAGQNITDERLRFDFKHNQALTPEEIKEVEEMINEKTKEDLPVTSRVMPRGEAEKSGALAFFKEKYGDEVSVYTIGPSTLRQSADRSGSPFSREVCGGPHVDKTGEIGHVTITKEESAGSGVRRIYARLDD